MGSTSERHAAARQTVTWAPPSSLPGCAPPSRAAPARQPGCAPPFTVSASGSDRTKPLGVSTSSLLPSEVEISKKSLFPYRVSPQKRTHTWNNDEGGVYSNAFHFHNGTDSAVEVCTHVLGHPDVHCDLPSSPPSPSLSPSLLLPLLPPCLSLSLPPSPRFAPSFPHLSR